MKRLLLFCIALTMASLTVRGQGKIIDYEFSGDDIVVTYSLDSYASVTSLSFSTNRGANWKQAKNVNGEIGGIFAPGKHRIIWRYMEDYPTGLASDQIVFQIRCTKEKTPWQKFYRYMKRGGPVTVRPMYSYNYYSETSNLGAMLVYNFNMDYDSGIYLKGMVAPYGKGNEYSEVSGRVFDNTQAPSWMQGWSVTGGVCIGFVYFGAGYAQRSFFKDLPDGKSFLNTDRSGNYMDVDAGLLIPAGRLRFSAGTTLLIKDGVQAELTLGLGFSF